MKCPICGKHTLPGAKLCGPCRAALKRARDDSVWELPPGLKRPGAAAAEAPPPRWVLGAQRSMGWRGWALVMLAGGLCIGGALKLASPGQGAEAAEPVARANVPSGTVAVPPSTVSAPAPAAVVPASVAKTSTVDTAAAAQPAVAQPPVHDEAQPRRSHERAAAPVRAVKAPTAPSGESTSPSPPAAPPPPAAETVRVAAAPAPAPARPADPWQSLKDALGRCASEDLFARIACEHRARTRWCDGHWGEVAQCPGMATNDHGQ